MSRALRVLGLPLLFVAAPLAAQLAPASAGGLVAYAEETRMLGHNLRVLVIGAHPDDEDTELLAWLARGKGAEAAYLALNRGEGGQNLVGGELGESLGLLRTEELLSARQLDGARQYFTRAYDFGFSKTLDDTWAQWPRDSILKDVIRIVRKFRPQVIVTIFTGTPRDGHGQHQAAGWAARAAFEAAGDSTRFPELQTEEDLAAWTPLKLYQSTRFNGLPTTLTLKGGALDRVTGLTYHQLAMASRSRHRSQNMGQLQSLGPSAIRMALVTDRTGKGPDGFFAGVDTTLAPVLGAAAARAYSAQVALIRSQPDSLASAALDSATRILQAAKVASPVLRDQARHLARARAIALGLAQDATADDARVTPGQTLAVTISAANGGVEAVTLADSLVAPSGWAVSHGSSDGALALAPGALVSREFHVTVPSTADATTPYFLREPRDGDLYRWPASARASWGDPFEPAPLRAALALPGDLVPVEREVTDRTNDQVIGEVRLPVVVQPAIDVRVDRDTVLLAAGTERRLRLLVSVDHAARDTVRGQVTIEVPAGWREPPPQPFAFTREDERDAYSFDVTIPASARAGRYTLRAVAVTSAGRRYSEGLRSLAYNHVRPRAWTQPSSVSVVLANLTLPSLKAVGYIRGAADRVPEALVAAGVPVTLLTPAQLENGDLSRFDAIVVGPRAYEIDAALVQHNRRLMDYVKAGGLLLVQYQQYQFIQGGFAPLPLTIAQPHDRVTDEHSPVTVLDPSSPVFTAPNRIVPSDWDNWIQERGLYFAHTWDDGYTPLLSMHDPDEAPMKGSLLVATVGKGRYVYTGLSFFRELPAGVPGAFRLFANLLALHPAPVP
ncbi:MAG TPA: PIG-L family deacetylase [Gemmatimonadales bacterium]|jgi:LmbE family N-acetylglucosaminyl deacetylase|nr:PIG-L family deacetylase [Gemmatimonadales bacterium]